MKKIWVLGLLATSLAFADETPAATVQEDVISSKGYVSLGLGPFPLPLPLFGIGGRYQNNHHGFDGSVQFISFGKDFTLARENFDYLYFFKPDLKSQFYVGGGAAVTEFFSDGRMRAFLSPQAVLGRQYTTKTGDIRYFQVQIDPVFLDLNKVHKKNKFRTGTFPVVVLSYGICF